MADPINPENVQDWDTALNTDPMFTSRHIFSTDDVTVSFAGETLGTIVNPDPVFDTTGENGTKNADGTILYPLNTEFGYVVTDFENARAKTLEDSAYEEGWVGDFEIAGEQAGLVVSDAPTDTFKTPALLGTWLSGLGGNSVKASTEHYVVMQNILSDQVTQGVDLDGDGLFDSEGETPPLNAEGEVAVYPLDNDLYVISDNDAYNGLLLTDAIDLARATSDDWNGDGVYDIKDILHPNETEIDTNIAVSSDYSVTVKDDGKLLYRWGNMIKKPNDVRMEAHMELPDEWDEYNPITSLRNIYQVTSAELVIHHTITNNPNDQIRPEDFENEAATGIKPAYDVIPDYNEDDLGAREVWVVPGGPDYTDSYPAGTNTSNYNADLDQYGYYAGDGTFYPAGTILRDDHLAELWAGSDLAAIGAADGAEGYTNAWYTIMDREPFEPVLNEDGTEYAGSGPRWRLQPDKYGQDLPSVTIPEDPSQTANPQKDQVKYEVGAETQTVVNLLDWGEPAVPLSLSAGWQDIPGDGVSVNGMNYTDGFDFAVYIKGDIKPATIYSSELVMDYALVTPYAANAVIEGTDGDDFLVGIANNTFNIAGADGGGSDLVVVTYGSSIEGVPLTQSEINGFTIGEDAIGLIDLGVDAFNFDDKISQELVDDDTDLEIWLDRDGAGTDETRQLIATLVDFSGELDASGGLVLGSDFYLANPGPGVEPGDDDDPNVIDGTAGADVLTGTVGDDIINGLAGNDTIYALAGDDELNGGSGLDRLYGGAGEDVFVFEEGTQLDIVYDFEDGVDRIELVGLNTADFDAAVTISERSSGTLITVGEDRMLLRGFDSGDGEITSADFIFDDTTFADTLLVG